MFVNNKVTIKERVDSVISIKYHGSIKINRARSTEIHGTKVLFCLPKSQYFMVAFSLSAFSRQFYHQKPRLRHHYRRCRSKFDQSNKMNANSWPLQTERLQFYFFSGVNVIIEERQKVSIETTPTIKISDDRRPATDYRIFITTMPLKTFLAGLHPKGAARNRQE